MKITRNYNIITISIIIIIIMTNKFVKYLSVSLLLAGFFIKKNIEVSSSFYSPRKKKPKKPPCITTDQERKDCKFAQYFLFFP
jgi:hypothetical protein